MTPDVIEPQVDIYLAALGSEQFDLGDTGNALQRLFDFGFEKIVGIPQVTAGRELAAENRFVVRAPVAHIDALNVRGKLAADTVDLFPNVSQDHVDVLTPIEANADPGAIILGVGLQARSEE